LWISGLSRPASPLPTQCQIHDPQHFSPHWRGWLKPENRCLVPANGFSEYAPEPNPETKKKDVVWFALSEDQPVFAFAGIWIEFKGDRGTKSKPIPGPHNVYGFLTTELNAVVKQTRSQNEAYNRCRHVVVRHSKFDHVRCHGFKHSKEDSP
jgi:hypothetical protein